MIDIHTHILPGLDDGAQTIEDSIRMARIASEGGVTKLIVTPHCNVEGSFDNFYDDFLLYRFHNFQEIIKKEQIPIEIILGMEVFGTEEVPNLLYQGKITTLNHSRYLLLEFGFHKDLLLMDYLIQELTDQGIHPIIAHPERYPYIQKNPNMVMRWLEQGCFIQVNKGSMAGGFGYKARDLAFYFLEHQLVSFVASDMHGPDIRTPDLSRVYNYIETNYSRDYANILFVENPNNVIEDKELIRIPNKTVEKTYFIEIS